MDAFILAAGLGTRLRPLTLTTPKALVEVGGVPVLERVARRLIAAGVDRLILNTAHLGEKVEAYARAKQGFGTALVVSHEPEGPYETGGALKYAAPLIRHGQSFLIHNADVLTNVDLAALYRAHLHSDALATLAVVPATSDRFLLFDDSGLVGYGVKGEEKLVREPSGAVRRVDFCGVQAAGPDLLKAVRAVPERKFSIMDVYLRHAREGGRVAAFEAPGQTFLDIGTPEALERAHTLADELDAAAASSPDAF